MSACKKVKDLGNMGSLSLSGDLSYCVTDTSVVPVAQPSAMFTASAVIE